MSRQKNWDTYAVDTEKVSELMMKLEPTFDGYSRAVITMACSSIIAAMLGPAASTTRDDYLERLPLYLRGIWAAMDEEIKP